MKTINKTIDYNNIKEEIYPLIDNGQIFICDKNHKVGIDDFKDFAIVAIGKFTKDKTNVGELYCNWWTESAENRAIVLKWFREKYGNEPFEIEVFE